MIRQKIRIVNLNVRILRLNIIGNRTHNPALNEGKHERTGEQSNGDGTKDYGAADFVAPDVFPS